MTVSRRMFLAGSAAMSLTLPGIGLASVPNVPANKKLVFVHMSGGLDQLSCLIPFKDPNYYNQFRPGISVGTYNDPENELYALTSRLGLHPNFNFLKELADGDATGGAVLIPNAGVEYGIKSHFKQSDLIARGIEPFLAANSDIKGNKALSGGFIGRLSFQMGGNNKQAAPITLSTSQTIPLICHHQSNFTKLISSGTIGLNDVELLDSLFKLYDGKNNFMRHQTHLERKSVMTFLDSLSEEDKANLMESKGDSSADNFYKIAQLTNGTASPNIFFTRIGGCDHHRDLVKNVGLKISELDNAIRILADPANGNGWKNTIVVFYSEFGRRVTRNGSEGVDHGEGGLMIVAGGGLRGVKVREGSFWNEPMETSRLSKNNVPVLTDYRRIFKAVLQEHFGIERALSEDILFPLSEQYTPLNRLLS